MDELTYYKLKARVLELAEDERKMRALQELIQQKRLQTFVEAGLDPQKSYSLDDATCTAVETP